MVKLVVLANSCLFVTLTACSQEAPTSRQTGSSQPIRRQPPSLTELDAYAAGKSTDEVAHYIFRNYSCNDCHTLGKEGQFTFTSQGEERKKSFEGCIALLTTMNVVAQISDTQRTPEQKIKADRFDEFGCSFCHQIQPGKMGLTETGKKLVSLHLACTDVQRILNK